MPDSSDRVFIRAQKPRFMAQDMALDAFSSLAALFAPKSAAKQPLARWKAAASKGQFILGLDPMLYAVLVRDWPLARKLAEAGCPMDHGVDWPAFFTDAESGSAMLQEACKAGGRHLGAVFVQREMDCFEHEPDYRRRWGQEIERRQSPMGRIKSALSGLPIIEHGSPYQEIDAIGVLLNRPDARDAWETLSEALAHGLEPAVADLVDASPDWFWSQAMRWRSQEGWRWLGSLSVAEPKPDSLFDACFRYMFAPGETKELSDETMARDAAKLPALAKLGVFDLPADQARGIAAERLNFWPLRHAVIDALTSFQVLAPPLVDALAPLALAAKGHIALGQSGSTGWVSDGGPCARKIREESLESGRMIAEFHARGLALETSHITAPSRPSARL